MADKKIDFNYPKQNSKIYRDYSAPPKTPEQELIEGIGQILSDFSATPSSDFVVLKITKCFNQYLKQSGAMTEYLTPEYKKSKVYWKPLRLEI